MQSYCNTISVQISLKPRLPPHPNPHPLLFPHYLPVSEKRSWEQSYPLSTFKRCWRVGLGSRIYTNELLLNAII